MPKKEKSFSPPLAEQLRPKNFDEVVGQDHILGPKSLIQTSIKKKKPLSLILWGPPGSGKTTIARLYAAAFSMKFEAISAVFSGIADLKRIFENTPEPVFLFVDEIHRFNKSQQDAFLPYLENGKLILVGATVENPSFYLNKALLSRMRVLKLNVLNHEALDSIFTRYEKLKGKLKHLTPENRELIIYLAHGDGRHLLNLIENYEQLDQKLNENELLHFLQEKAPLFDRNTDQHYDLISALHKSLRGSDPDAAIYWFNRMLIGGEDPLYIARRLIRMASEDIGLADPQALSLAIAARDAYEMLGSPEGELALAEAVIYLAMAPKSNAIYIAYEQSKNSAIESSQYSPPMIIVNAPTPMMKKMGYGKGYIYDHNTPHLFSGQNYFPDGVERQIFYRPKGEGFENEIKKRLEYFKKIREQINTQDQEKSAD